MYQLLQQFLREWNSNKNQRTKLQQAYLVTIVALSAVSGFISLLNNATGRLLMMAAAVLAFIYVVNGIIWALLDAFVVPVLPKDSASNHRTKKK